MPWTFRTVCSKCAHEWEGTEVTFRVGPAMEPYEDAWQEFYCSSCYIGVALPKCVDRNAWNKWYTQFAASQEYRQSAILQGICTRINERFAGQPLYTPHVLDAGVVPCPACNRVLEAITNKPISIFCPKCGERAAQIEGYEGHLALAPE